MTSLETHPLKQRDIENYFGLYVVQVPVTLCIFDSIKILSFPHTFIRKNVYNYYKSNSTNQNMCRFSTSCLYPSLFPSFGVFGEVLSSKQIRDKLSSKTKRIRKRLLLSNYIEENKMNVVPFYLEQSK